MLQIILVLVLILVGLFALNFLTGGTPKPIIRKPKQENTKSEKKEEVVVDEKEQEKLEKEKKEKKQAAEKRRKQKKREKREEKEAAEKEAAQKKSEENEEVKAEKKVANEESKEDESAEEDDGFAIVKPKNKSIKRTNKTKKEKPRQRVLFKPEEKKEEKKKTETKEKKIEKKKYTTPYMITNAYKTVDEFWAGKVNHPTKKSSGQPNKNNNKKEQPQKKKENVEKKEKVDKQVEKKKKANGAKIKVFSNIKETSKHWNTPANSAETGSIGDGLTGKRGAPSNFEYIDQSPVDKKKRYTKDESPISKEESLVENIVSQDQE